MVKGKRFALFRTGNDHKSQLGNRGEKKRNRKKDPSAKVLVKRHRLRFEGFEKKNRIRVGVKMFVRRSFFTETLVFALKAVESQTMQNRKGEREVQKWLLKKNASKRVEKYKKSRKKAERKGGGWVFAKGFRYSSFNRSTPGNSL